jgi:hypothetical protein
VSLGMGSDPNPDNNRAHALLLLAPSHYPHFFPWHGPGHFPGWPW